MALTDPQDTLAYHASRVLCAQRDMSDVPCASVAKALGQYQLAHNDSDPGHNVPEEQALWFYGMNHGMALIASEFAPLEPLPEWELSFVKRYHAELAPRAVRAFYYLLLICTREARHNKSLGTPAKMQTMENKFGAQLVQFFKGINGGEPAIHKQFVNKPPAVTIGTYTESLCWQFYQCSWHGGYGGPKWGQIADCLHRFVTGEFSPEMMLDTVWTLSHNNGPIFNKGLFYEMYGPHIIRILDIQRSGQIPQAIMYDKTLDQYATMHLRGLMHQVKERFPEAVGDYVDWDLVEALGSVKKYPNEKKAQHAEHGQSPEAKAAAAAAAKAKIEKDLAEQKAKEEFAKNHIEVLPGLFVLKVTMKRAA